MSIHQEYKDRERYGFAIGYHTALQRAGVVFTDVTFHEMSDEYKEVIYDLSVQAIRVDKIARKKDQS